MELIKYHTEYHDRSEELPKHPASPSFNAVFTFLQLKSMEQTVSMSSYLIIFQSSCLEGHRERRRFHNKIYQNNHVSTLKLLEVFNKSAFFGSFIKELSWILADQVLKVRIRKQITRIESFEDEDYNTILIKSYFCFHLLWNSP